jgi:hypothetical protein
MGSALAVLRMQEITDVLPAAQPDAGDTEQLSSAAGFAKCHGVSLRV